MRRFLFPLLLVPLAVSSLAVAAGADVVVRAGVRPDSVKQCGPAKAFVAIANTGERPIEIRASLILTDDLGTQVLGPYVGRLMLAAGERRMREFRFMVPEDLPSASYQWVMRALANDLTRDAALAPFEVVKGVCGSGSADEAKKINSEEEILRSLGLEEDDTTTDTKDETWGQIKKRYKD